MAINALGYDMDGSPNETRQADQRLQNYTDNSAEMYRNMAYQALRDAVPGFRGGGFACLGDCGDCWPAFVVSEALTIGCKRKTRTWFVGRKFSPDRWVITQLK